MKTTYFKTRTVALLNTMGLTKKRIARVTDPIISALQTTLMVIIAIISVVILLMLMPLALVIYFTVADRHMIKHLAALVIALFLMSILPERLW